MPHSYATCGCDLFNTSCNSPATQEDLLCDDCRWFKHNRLGVPRPWHGVTTRRDGVDYGANTHFNDAPRPGVRF